MAYELKPLLRFWRTPWLYSDAITVVPYMTTTTRQMIPASDATKELFELSHHKEVIR